MMNLSSKWHTLIIALLVIVSFEISFNISKYKVGKINPSEFILSYFHYVPTHMVKIFALGYDQVVADFIWIVTIQSTVFDGDPTEKQLLALFNMANLVTDLDPTNELAYRYVATVLSYHGKIEWADHLYKKSDKSPFESWKMNLFKARFYEDFYKDHQKAVHYYYLASKQEDSPLYFPGVVTKLILDNYDKFHDASAQVMMQEMLEIAKDEDIQNRIKKRIDEYNKKIETEEVKK